MINDVINQIKNGSLVSDKHYMPKLPYKANKKWLLYVPRNKLEKKSSFFKSLLKKDNDGLLPKI